jgi:hypothetical protein
VLPHSAGGREVGGDRGEVEWGDRKHEAVERAILDAVPHLGAGGDRLLGVDALEVVDVEAEEVDELGGGVDLGLMDRLALAEDRRGVDPVAEFVLQQPSGAQEDRGTVLPRHRGPRRACPLGLGERLGDVGLAGLVADAGHVRVPMRHDQLAGVAGGQPLSADDQRDFDLHAELTIELGLDTRPLGAARGVAEHGFVDRRGDRGCAELRHGLHVPRSGVSDDGGRGPC